MARALADKWAGLFSAEIRICGLRIFGPSCLFPSRATMATSDALSCVLQTQVGYIQRLTQTTAHPRIFSAALPPRQNPLNQPRVALNQRQQNAGRAVRNAAFLFPVQQCRAFYPDGFCEIGL